MTDANFNALFNSLMSTNFLAKSKPAFGANPTAKTLLPKLQAGTLLLPTVFRDGYATPLMNNLDAVIARLSGGGSSPDPVMLETLTACIYQHSDPALRAPLHRFLAVISNLYRSFLDARKRSNLSIQLSEVVPPLATLQSDPSDGPFTVTVENVQSLSGGVIGVVSLPRTFANQPLFYGSLAHETGGHDVIHADLDLMPELRSSVHSLFTGSNAWLGLLWDYWMDEAAADVYGVLNMGPTYGHSLALLLAIFIMQSEKNKSKAPKLRNASGATDDGTLDPHPTDILRLGLISGVIDSLQGLSPATRDAYNTQLATLSSSLMPDGAATIDLAGFARVGGGASMNFDQSERVDMMMQAARQVGALIATVPLHALAGHSIQDLETWDDSDENTTVSIAGRLHTNSAVNNLGDDAQLVAGLTLAAIQNPGALAGMSALINDALDGSYAADPFWGTLTRDKMVIRPARSKGDELQIDPWAERIIDFNPLEDSFGSSMIEAVSMVDRHKIAPIPWPAGAAPEIDTSLGSPAPDAVLPKADFVFITWTSAEANAMAACMTPGSWAMPPSTWKGPQWIVYTNQWDAKFAGRSTGRAPAATSHYIGKYALVRIGGHKVLLFKSNFHLARDNKSLPVKDMFKQVIQQTGAKLVITTGTAGAIGKKLKLGDVAVANTATFKLDGTFKNTPFNGRTFTSNYTVPADGHIKLVNSTLVAANAGQLSTQRTGNPKVYTSTGELGEPNTIVTTDKFEFDDAHDDFKLQGKGSMVEMDDAILGLAIEEMGATTRWLAIRNASDPQMPTKDAKASSDIYMQYGYWTSIPSALACWATVLDYKS